MTKNQRGRRSLRPALTGPARKGQPPHLSPGDLGQRSSRGRPSIVHEFQGGCGLSATGGRDPSGSSPSLASRGRSQARSCRRHRGRSRLRDWQHRIFRHGSAKIHELCEEADMKATYEEIEFGTKLAFHRNDSCSDPLGTDAVPSGSESFAAACAICGWHADWQPNKASRPAVLTI